MIDIPGCALRTTALSGLSRLALPLLALALSACGVAVAQKTPVPSPSPAGTAGALASPTPAGPVATATPDAAVLRRDGGIAIIQAAYNRLLDEYIDPVDSSRLLDAAWAQLAQEAGAESIEMPLKPAFSDDRAADFELFRNAYLKLIDGVAEPSPLRYAVIKGMTQSLQDCHTYFLPPVQAKDLIDSRAGKGTVGIGVDLAGVPPLVAEVVTGGPAAAAGVLVGDRIIGVDGKDTSSLGPASTFELIDGDEGTTVRITLRRPSRDAPLGITAVRARVNPPNVDARIIGGDAGKPKIGYARIRNFVDGGIATALRDALNGFEAQGVSGWVLDLRGNPGGRLDVGAESLFVKDGVVVRARGRDGTVADTQATGDALAMLRPTVLLTNNRTGSVAEVFAAALQEYGAAYVIGGTTNGCVGYTDIQPLGDGTSMAVTTNVNLGPVSQKVLNGVGVVPDEPVARTQDDIASLRDPQLDAAIAHLGG